MSTLNDAISQLRNHRTPVSRLGLSTRAQGVIQSLGIRFIEELAFVPDSHILMARNCGRRTFDEIKHKLSLYRAPSIAEGDALEPWLERTLEVLDPEERQTLEEAWGLRPGAPHRPELIGSPPERRARRALRVWGEASPIRGALTSIERHVASRGGRIDLQSLVSLVASDYPAPRLNPEHVVRFLMSLVPTVSLRGGEVVLSRAARARIAKESARRLVDVLVEAIQRIGRPAHYAEIARVANELLSAEPGQLRASRRGLTRVSVHFALSSSAAFVKTGKDTFWLAEDAGKR